MRVQIPTYHDMWMKGDRWGDVVRIHQDTGLKGQKIEIAHVRLDKSGGLERVILADCTVVDVEPLL